MDWHKKRSHMKEGGRGRTEEETHRSFQACGGNNSVGTTLQLCEESNLVQADVRVVLKGRVKDGLANTAVESELYLIKGLVLGTLGFGELV
ncbi:hypothetical protein V6N12_012333 [Hibiscus sabdariffa]|uniref:Uncharacterized protein n=1 Tax=Hibiscus sabdariffa TaxID=183260 RepID=A0ABR2CJN2_9ROSI